MALYAFDGTWNIRDLKAAVEASQPRQYGADATFRRETTETNVHRFAEFYGPPRVEYLQGVGTRFALLGRALGGIFGVGAKYRLRRMYLALCARYHGGDTDIDLVGFSRGAALALHFSHVIARYGIRRPDAPRHLAWHYYEGLGWTFRFPRADGAAAAPPIRFLGLWDTVGSFGIPIGPFRNLSKRWWITSIPGIVRRSFHAMALDEVRATFALVRPQRSEERSRHYEVWFRGVHSNIGGGYFDRGLSDISLAWMIEMYLWTLDKEGAADIDAPPYLLEALQLISPRRADGAPRWPAGTYETLEPDPDGELGRPADGRRQTWRDVPAGALVHHSVFLRTENLVNDHHRGNRPLLRRVPRDARPVYDPPFFYSETPRQQAVRVATEAFHHIPVRAADWFTVRGVRVVRSDDWLAPGDRRRSLTDDISLASFTSVAAEWLLQGRPAPHAIVVAQPLVNAAGAPVEPLSATAWIVDVLEALEPYVPALRDFTAPAPVRPQSPGQLA